MLPLQANIATAYRQTQEVAKKLEAELGEEQGMFIDGCERDWAALPHPDAPWRWGLMAAMSTPVRGKTERPAGLR